MIDELSFFKYFDYSYSVDQVGSDYAIVMRLNTLHGEAVLECIYQNGKIKTTVDLLSKDKDDIYPEFFVSFMKEKYQSEMNEKIELIQKRKKQEETLKKMKSFIDSMNQISYAPIKESIVLDKHKASLEYYFTVGENGYKSVSLKVGITKHYIVKDIRSFIDAFTHQDTITYGKDLELSHMVTNFIEPDQAFLTYLVSMPVGRVKDSKYLLVSDFAFNEMLERLKGHTIYLNERPYKVALNLVDANLKVNNKCELEFNINKESYELIRSYKTIYVVDKKQDTIDVLNAKKPEIYEFFYQNQGVCVEPVLEEFKERVYSKYQDAIHISPEVESKFKLSDLEIDAYFDYQDGAILVHDEAHIGDKPVYNALLLERRGDQLKYQEYQEYMKQLGFVNQRMTDDSDVLNFFSMDFSTLKRLCNVYLSESIENKQLTSFDAQIIKVQYNNNMLEAFLEDSIYTEDELRAIYQAIKKKKKYVLLSGDRIVDLDNPEAQEFKETVEDLDLDTEHLMEAKPLSVVESLKAFSHENSIEIDDYLSNMMSEIKNFKKANYELPALEATLRRYQKEGYEWLRILSKYNVGGILADDMGLGKTLEMISLIESDDKELPSLIVCPKSLIFNWKNEFNRFAPLERVVEIYGNAQARKKIIQSIDDRKIIYITAYDSLRNDIEYYKNTFNYIVLDEAQAIKNIYAQKSQSAKALKGIHKFALTGTPIENNVIDLWSIFDFIMPGYFEELPVFMSKYQQDEAFKEKLAKRVAPFILRRCKEDVLKDLPPKFERIVTAEMTDMQRKIYDAERLNAKEKLESGGKAFDVLPVLMRLRQICVDPQTYIQDYHGGSGKMEALKEIVDSYVKDGHQILIFSQFVKALNIVEEYLHQVGIDYYMITGDTKAEERISLVNRFNANNDVPVFLISLKAGGTGLNLVGADTVIHLDPWWNSAAENQATDRAHRIGQKKNVEVIKLICDDSIEGRVIELQNLKNDLIDKLISNNEESVTNASLEDISFILN